MKHIVRFLLIPVIFAQMTTYSSQAKAELKWWEAAIIGSAAGVVAYATLSHQDESNMNLGMRGAFRTNITLGDRVAWRGDNHEGHYIFEAEGRSRDGRYSNCRRVRPVAYDRNNREVDMRRYPPTCACQTADNRWKRIPLDQFEERRAPQGPHMPPGYENFHYMTADNSDYTKPSDNTYDRNSPYRPFFSGRDLRRYNKRPRYPQPPHRPPQQSYDSGVDNAGLRWGLNIEI